MKFILVLNIITSLIFEFNKVTLSNNLKNEANTAFQKGQYMLSIRYYHELITTFKVKDENLLLNLSHAYFKIGDYHSASLNYKKLLSTSDKKSRSLVNHQLGVIAAFQGKEKLALSFFKNALKADYKNEPARYNFELIFRKLEKEKTASKGKTQTGKTSGNSTEPFTKDQGRKSAGNTNPAPSRSEDNNEKSNSAGSSFEQQDMETRIPSKVPEPSNDQNKNDVMIDEKGPDAASALQTARFNEIHLSETKAQQILESMKEQEFLMLLQLSKKSSDTKNKVIQDW